MARRLAITEARRDFADTVNRAHYGEEVTFITKHGKDIAAVVPVTHPSLQGTLPPKKLPKRLR
jgi:prevent-host-death family protein